MEHFALVAAAMFIGGVISGLAGFAFSAAAGAILVHILAPRDAVPLLMACSVAVQAASLLWLRQIMRWRDSLKFIGGGMLGVAPALYLLTHMDAASFRIGFGVFLAIYSGYMLLRPRFVVPASATARSYDAAVGFAGGMIGGLTAMPGAAPILWCDLRGLPKERQRGLVQPFVAAMQVASMILLGGSGNLPPRLLGDLVVTLPAVAAGTALGLYLFGKVDELTFRRVVPVTLLVSGLSFVMH
jgi:uncharacterized membrane protein YfcA